jgi:membrane protein
VVRRGGTARSGGRRAARRIAARGAAELRLALRAAGGAAVNCARGAHLTYASSIAYYALLSLFPCLLLLLALLGTAAADEEARRAVLALVLKAFPAHVDFVATQLDGLRGARLEFGLVGGATTVWAALGVFRALSAAVNSAWGVERRPSYLRHQLVAFLMLVAAGVLLVGALALASVLAVVRASYFPRLVELVPPLAPLAGLTGAVFDAMPTLLFMLIVGLVLYFVPNTRVRLREVWLGAVVTGLLWRLALAGFSWYMSDPARLSVHRSVAAVVAFLLWVYVSAVILLYGVEFTAAYARLRRAAEGPSA